MNSLRRLSIGSFDWAHALPVDDLTAETIASWVISASDAVGFLPVRILTEAERGDVLLGRPVNATLDAKDTKGNYVRLVDMHGELVALAVADETDRQLWPKKVLMQ